MNIHPESKVREHSARSQAIPADVHDDEEDAFSFASLIGLAWDNRWLLIATTSLGLAISALQVKSETPLYTAASRIMLKTTNENVVNVQSVVPQARADYLTINTELEVFKSSKLMRRTVDTLSLEQDPEFNPSLRSPAEWKRLIDYDGLREAVGLQPEPRPVVPAPEEARTIAAAILASKVSVSTLPNTVIFTISVQTQDPQKSARIANTVADLYVEGQRDKKYQALEQAMTWVGKRVVELKSDLEAAEAAVEDFSTGATLVSKETLVANTQRLKSMRARESELADSAARMAQRVERLAALRKNSDFAALAAAIEDRRLSAMTQELADSGQSASPPAPITADDPRLVRFQALFGPWLDGLRADARREQAAAKAAARSVAELEREVDSQSADLVKLRQLQREAEATRLIYESFLSRLKEISVQQGVQQADSEILSRAGLGYQTYPQVRPAILKGGLVGLVLGLMLVAVRNVLRNTVRTPEELEAATGLTVIGAIPDDRIRRPDWLLDHIVNRPASGTAEAVRSLRTAIQLSNVDESPRVIMVTSSVPDEGKSVLAAALAQSSALPDCKVLLVDGDLRRRTLRKYFDVEAEAGLISLLSGETTLAETVCHDPGTGLDLLIADDGKVTPADLFASQNFRDFIADARATYDLIIFDTPPVLAVPETRVIAQHADVVVYSVRWNATTRRMVQTGIDMLRQVNVRSIGLALTRIDPRRMDRYGYYGYGYGSRGKKLHKYYTG